MKWLLLTREMQTAIELSGAALRLVRLPRQDDANLFPHGLILRRAALRAGPPSGDPG